MPSGPSFPAFLKLEHRPDGTAKAGFIAEIGSTLAAAKGPLDRFGSDAQRALAAPFATKPNAAGFLGGLEAVLGNARGEISRFNVDAKRLLDQAVSTPRTAGGALNLDVGGIRAGAAAQQAKANAARELAAATEIAAQAEGRLDAATQRAVAGLRQEAAVQEQAAAASLQHANAVQRVQAVLERQAAAADRATAATRRASAANDNATVSAGQHRAGLAQLGFQISDIGQGFAVGTAPAIIFAQQAGQTAQALQLLGGSARGVGAFLGGPWGIALTTAAVVLAPFIAKLFETSSAAAQVSFATNAVGEAQSILGGALDLATGKINTQSSALIGLARAQLLVAQVQARTRIADARRGVADIQSRPVRFTGGGLGGGFSAGRRDVDARDSISAGVLGGTLDSSTAVQRLENLRRVGRLTDEQFNAAAASVANLGVELSNLKVYGEAGKLLDGTGGRSLLKPDKAKTPRKGRTGDGGAAAREEFGEDAAKKIANIADQFSRIPAAVQQANKSIREVDDIIDDLARKRPLNFEKAIADAKALKTTIGESLGQPFRDALEAETRGIEVQRLRIAGREAEADVLAYQYDLAVKLGVQDRAGIEAGLARLGIGKAEYQAGLRNLEVQRQLSREGQRAAAAQQRQLSLIADTRSNLVSAVAGLRNGGVGAIGGLIKNTLASFNQAAAESLVEKIFGDAFADSQKAVEEGNRALARTGLDTARALNDLARAANAAAGAEGAGTSTTEAIGQDIIVTAKKLDDLNNPRNLLGLITKNLAKAVGVSDEDAAKIGKAVGANVEGALYGQIGSSLILGKKGSTTGAGIGGAFGEAAFKKLAPELFKKLGDFAGPLGSIAGGILGGLVGGLLKKTKTGSATLSIGADGVGVGSTSGNSKSRKAAASGAGDSVSDALNRIAEQLGGSAGGPISVSIGIKDKNYRVDPTGQGRTKGAGVLDFGQDQAAALKFAIADAIKDGVLTGISAGAQRLLKGGSDLDKQLSKALDFQGALGRAKALRDPVGAALDTLDKEFSRLKRIFDEAGASAAEAADLEALYGSERTKAVKAATESIAGSLKSLIADLTIGNDAFSLRDRKALALAKYDPLAARVAAGDSTANDDFADAARVLLDIERQLSGSQGEYFTLLDQVKGLAAGELGKLDAIAERSINRDSPLTKSAVPTNDNQNVVDAIAVQTQALIDGLGAKLDAANANLGAIISQRLLKQDAPALPMAVGYW